MVTIMTVRTALVAALIAASAMQHAGAHDYPTRPLTIIVPSAAGGGNDIMARVLGERMSSTLGQQFVIENRTGAGGIVGARAIAKAPPDGYTLGMGNTGILAQGPAYYPNAGYDPRKDFAPIGLIANAPLSIIVHPSVEARTVRELIELARRDPGKLTYGSGGAGTPNHLGGVMFSNVTGVSLTHVPFRGAGPAVAGVVGGHVSMMFSSLPPVISNVKAGLVRIIAMTSVQRSQTLPEVPTLHEAGFPGFEAAQRYGLLAPASTPPAIIAKLNAALREALTSDEVKARISAEGADPMPSSPEQYAADIDHEATKWAEVVKQAGGPASDPAR